ncbi:MULTISPECIES: ATP-binding cassette domain-containing protein [unclassified Aureimonas]|uniref:ATP-binding cassette domain-containing protein n=1 Tax=unclassified Aureimonas TaxID=2615206 RepID=UPI0006FD0385|nr:MULTISPECIES: ATP-binding cassette domain-containing protein [unclassified Aureimonas]KQT58542.1 hypothetical protein ASG62_24610 [Aureimonas sp. Leaf427]KQT65153.1 hypothetical protein ASG54_22715 [Aureimonas sp. Leaf460]
MDHRSAGHHPVLDDINIELAPGKLLVLIGPSGGGKSLLARIVTGASEPDAGRVTMDGIPTARYPRHQWASISGYQPQLPNLFHGTIASNIARFRADLGMPTIYEAANRAGAHQAILSLPQGYQEIVGQIDAEIPAGLLQRIALARALIGKPRLVVLDEPFAHLDSDLETRLIATIDQMRSAGTSFVVSQKQAIVTRADHVLMVRDGTAKPVQITLPQTARPGADGKRPAILATQTSHGANGLRRAVPTAGERADPGPGSLAPETSPAPLINRSMGQA